MKISGCFFGKVFRFDLLHREKVSWKKAGMTRKWPEIYLTCCILGRFRWKVPSRAQPYYSGCYLLMHLRNFRLLSASQNPTLGRGSRVSVTVIIFAGRDVRCKLVSGKL